MIADPETDPLQQAAKMNLLMDSNSDYILPIADAVLLQFEDKVKEYRKGKKGLIGIICGRSNKKIKRKSRPKSCK